ncbi:MAG: baseplate assembly protein [Pseudomonadota bacterium]
MNNTSQDLWGQDIALDNNGQAKLSANGELVLTDGVETGLQDIRLRLFTRLGELFYDSDFGSLLHDWILEESTTSTRAAFESEVIMRVEEDPRVMLGSVSCSVVSWDATSISAQLRFTFVGEYMPNNLILQVDTRTSTFVLRDVLVRTNSLDSYI